MTGTKKVQILGINGIGPPIELMVSNVMLNSFMNLVHW